MAFLFLIFGPMLAAGLLWLCARKKEALAWPIAFGMTAAELLVSLAFALGPDAARELPFLNGLGLRFALDGFRRVYIVLVAFMWMMTAALGREYFHGHGKLTRYWSFTLMTLGATRPAVPSFGS